MPRMHGSAWRRLKPNWPSQSPTGTACCASSMSSARSSRAAPKRLMPRANSARWSFGWLPLPRHSGKLRSASSEASMNEQKRDPDLTRGASPSSESGNQESRFLPRTYIEAEEIKAANVVSGVQYNTYNYLQTQKYTPPLHRPRRAEHFQDRVSERSWLLAHLQPGQIVTLCGPGGMGKTALVAEILWTLAPGDRPPASFPHGIVFHSFYGRPEAAVALEQLARTFGEDPLPTPAQAAQRALSGKQVLLVLDGVEEAENLEQVLTVCASCAVLVTSRRRSDAADPALLLDLQRLPLEEAVTVVQAWQAQRQTNAAVIERICQLVGGLPLVLRLVGSYLALNPDDAEDYLAWLEEDVWQALDQGSTTH